MEETSRLWVTPRYAGDVLVLEVHGNLIAGTEALRLREEARRLLDGGTRKLLLNMTGVRYVDSTGIGTLLAVKTSSVKANARMRMCSMPTAVAHLLAQLHLNRVLDVHPDEAAALAAFEADAPPDSERRLH